MTVSAEAYLAVVTETIGRVAAGQREGVGRAAELIAESLRADGVVHAFGTGHSEALAMEIAGRAGGLVPTNRIACAIWCCTAVSRPTCSARSWNASPPWRTASTIWPRFARRTSSCSPPTRA